MKSLYVLLPCYNEQDNIRILIDKWLIQKSLLYQKGYRLKIIAIDDKSIDNTLNIIKEQAAMHNEIIPVFFNDNKGLGGGLLYGLLCFANESSSEDILIVMDADNTHEPKYSTLMIENIENGYDCVIASRFCNGSKIEGVKGYRNVLTLCAKLYYQSLLRIPNVRDYTCGYRSYSSKIIKKAYSVYNDKLVEEKSFACMMELLYKLFLIDARIKEIPFKLRYDYKIGKSKMKILKTIQSSIITAIKLKLIK